MTARASKSDFLYEEIRAVVQAGRYVPGQRIDPNALADEFSTSLTPVLHALHLMVGERVLVDHAREGGYQIPITPEVLLRNQYDWLQRHLVMACDMGFPLELRKRTAFGIAKRSLNIVLRTRALFDGIALATGDYCLYLSVRQTNDWLGPIQQATQSLFDNPTAEFAELRRHWLRRDVEHLKTALIDYHERRKRLVPDIVALVGMLPASQTELQHPRGPPKDRSPTR